MSTVAQAQPAARAETPAPSPHRRRVIACFLALLVLVVAGGVWVLTRGSGEVPYTDPRAGGALTLCDSSGQRITSGSVGAAPFVARAVGVTAAAGGETALAATGATLYAFQPREGLGAGEWSGQQLTADSTFTNAAHPIAQATTKDASIGDFLAAYPATWDGFVQLRLYVASPASGIAGTYDVVNVRVDGGDWSVVGKAGSASCTAGDATSFETSTLDYPSATR